METAVTPPAPSNRSRRIYVLWSVALTLLISTALFCWLVVVPYLETRTVILRICNTEGSIDSLGPQADRTEIARSRTIPPPPLTK